MNTQLINRSKLNNGPLQFSLFVPGRVNLIGDHTDYNHGLVLPCAIHLGLHFECYKLGSPWPLGTIAVSSQDEEFSLLIRTGMEESEEKLPSWSKYVRGCVHKFLGLAKSHIKHSVHIQIESSLSRGAGISSSAALCIGILTNLSKAFDFPIGLHKTARLAMEVEHEFAGTKCGLMDQLAILAAKKNQFLKIDFACVGNEKPKITPVPMHDSFSNYSLIIFNTNVKHSLAESAYNLRRQESSQGLKETPSLSLALEKLKKEPTSVVTQRAVHVLSENERVEVAALSLQSGDIQKLSDVMQESHQSLKNLYEVSCKELDIACHAAKVFAEKNSQEEFPIIGPRMTGGGFGGSTVQFIHKSLVEKFVQHFSQQENEYTFKTDILPTLIVTTPQDGVYSASNL